MIVLSLSVGLGAAGCGTMDKMKQWVGWEKGEDAEEAMPPEAQQETVMVDGKPYVRSKNPYWLTYPDQPEYIYVEKGREFKGMQSYLMDALAKRVADQQQKAAGKTVPPDKLQEMVRAEVDRILREQGLGGYVSRTRGDKAPYSGRAVAVVPDPETPSSQQGLNRTLATALADSLGRQKDVKVAPAEKVKEALAKSGIHGKLSLRRNLQALGDYLGVQAVILTGVVPPEKGGSGFYVAEVYDAFLGNKTDSVVAPAGSDGLRPESAGKFARDNSLRIGTAIMEVDWFGRVEFTKEGKVYLNLGQNAGVKTGDRLRVVTPGKEVVNPQTHAVLGFTADEVQGELKVTELLGTTGAVATALKGGPFKTNDKVKAAR
jgi:hypothetical protein